MACTGFPRSSDRRSLVRRMYSLRHEASDVRRVNARRSDRTTRSSDSSSKSFSSASMESDPKKRRAKALRHACGVVTSSWKRRETEATAARSLGARCASACVKSSFGSSAIGLRLSSGSLCFLITSKAGPSLFFVSGGVEACSYSSILFLGVRKGVDGFGEVESAAWDLQPAITPSASAAGRTSRRIRGYMFHRIVFRR